MKRAIFNAFYFSIFLWFARKILKKLSPMDIARGRGRYVVIVTTDPLQAIIGSFDSQETAFELLNHLTDAGWGYDNALVDTMTGRQFNDTCNDEWNNRKSASIYSGRIEVEVGLTRKDVEELKRIADRFGQTTASTTFPGITGTT